MLDCSLFCYANAQARWSYPRNHYYLCYARLLALLLCQCYDEITSIFAMLVCSLFAMPMLRCLPFACQPPKLPCKTSNPPCPSKPLIGYVIALLSPSYSVASCRWRANRWLAMLSLCSAPLIALLVAGEDWRPFLVGTFIYLLGYHYIAMLS